jgi:multiple sugar transport system ATP-binding protein
MVFQSYALYPNMTVAGNISFGMEMRGVPVDERKKAIDKVAKVLQITHLLDRKPSQLSGGQRQRVAMGRALVRDPKLFLFDEPLSNLDAKLRVDMRVEIKRLHQATGTSIVYVTHDQIEAMTLATKIAVMKDGEVQQFGTPAEIYNNPTNLFVADFMGSPAMNLLTATVERGNDRAGVAERPEGATLKLARKRSRNALGAYAGKQVIFGIRPEALTDPDGADRNAKNLFEGDCLIDVVEPAGSDTFAITKLGGKEVVARLRADARIAPGQTARLAFNLDKAVFFDPPAKPASAEPHNGNVARHRHHRLRHRRLDRRFRPCRIGRQHPDPRGAANHIPDHRKTATSAPSSSAAISAQRRCGTNTVARLPSTPAILQCRRQFQILRCGAACAIAARTLLEMQHREGISPAWPFPYEELEPWYSRAEQQFQVRGELGAGSDRAGITRLPYPFPPVPDEPAIASARAELTRKRPASLFACRSASTSTNG